MKDLKDINVKHKIFSFDGEDRTHKFDIETAKMNDYEICLYLYENILMVEKYYISDVSPLAVGGTDTFTRFYGGYVLERNGRNEAEVQY